MRVTKIDAARRQLITALRLFFDGGDPVSVYSLASNAHEVIDAICNHTGSVQTLTQEAQARLPAGKLLRRDYINNPCRNFFKHARDDADPDGAVDLSERNLHSLLMLAAEDYIRYRALSPIEVQVFQTWFCAVYPTVVAPGELGDGVRKAAAHYFPGIEMMSPVDQIAAGRRALEAARRNSDVADSMKTEESL